MIFQSFFTISNKTPIKTNIAIKIDITINNGKHIKNNIVSPMKIIKNKQTKQKLFISLIIFFYF